MQRRGFTLVELAAVVCVGAVVGSAGLVVWQPSKGKGPKSGPPVSRQKKDELQLRGIHQAMVVWAQQNKDRYPLPSALDTSDTTVSEKGRAKDTTANIDSVMVYAGLLSTEILVSPMEVNPNVVVNDTYQFDKPKKAVQPAKALWDPSLSAELDGSKKGNISYAHLQPTGERMKRWSNTFVSSEMIAATRGPEVKSVAQAADGTVTPTLAKDSSFALRLHGSGGSWSGYRCFNDNAVVLAKDVLKSGQAMPAKEASYTAADGKKRTDIWCYDEPDDPATTNTFLGLFTKAGETAKDFKATWD